jgi:hypothetical protein
MLANLMNLPTVTIEINESLGEVNACTFQDEGYPAGFTPGCRFRPLTQLASATAFLRYFIAP